MTAGTQLLSPTFGDEAKNLTVHGTEETPMKVILLNGGKRFDQEKLPDTVLGYSLCT